MLSTPALAVALTVASMRRRKRTLGYRSNGTMLYGFGPGIVLYEWRGFWWKSGPWELHYTGECDCEP